MHLRRLLTLSLLACSVSSAAAWNSVYFYDHATETLEFIDIASPSEQRVVAAGTIHDPIYQKDRYVAVVTSDAGEHWQQVKLDDAPLSLFFLNDSTGWMVTAKGLWRTDESGRSWTRVSKHGQQEILRVWFLDADHGFGVGAKMNVVETQDGGRSWIKIPGAKYPKADEENSFYTRVAFVDGKRGIILGTQLASTSSLFRPRFRMPPRMLQMETIDGGSSWKPKEAVLGGVVNGLKFSSGEGLALFHLSSPSGPERSMVTHVQIRGNQPPSVAYEGKDVLITDLGFFKNRAFLVGVDAAKDAEIDELPRKLRILESTNLKLWNEMEVDYNAEATHVAFAGTDPEHAFVATDTGMILRLADPQP